MVGKYEREALERRRDQLMNWRSAHGLTPWEAKELDDIVSKVGERVTNEHVRVLAGPFAT